MWVSRVRARARETEEEIRNNNDDHVDNTLGNTLSMAHIPEHSWHSCDVRTPLCAACSQPGVAERCTTLRNMPQP